MKKQHLLISTLLLAGAISTMAQGIYNNGAHIVSQTGSNWVVKSGNFTLTSESAVNLATMGNLMINDDASLTLTNKSCLTVNGTLSNNKGIPGLVLKSTSEGTGSLIVNGTTSGAATVERDLSYNKVHLISSPAADQNIIDFLLDNKDIAVVGSPGSYIFAMKDYNPSLNSWNNFFLSSKTGTFGIGSGYLALTIPDLGATPPPTVVSFKGGIHVGSTDVAVTPGWNLIGNPFTSTIKINKVDNNFLSLNASIEPTGPIDQCYAAVYFWNGSTNTYEPINNLSDATYAQSGQGFFVKIKKDLLVADRHVTFTTAMQVHLNTAEFKSGGLPVPEIKLMTAINNNSVSTMIKFVEGATNGLDVGYDAGIFKPDSGLVVYTKLVNDNGVDFQLQCLPAKDYDKLAIPVGIDSKSGGEIVFSVETVQLAQDCKVILEDKLTNTFTDLSKNNYKTTVAANTSGAGRFYLHTGDIVSGLDDQVLPEKFTAYAVRNVEIWVIGEVGSDAVATLYNGLGKVVLTKKLGAGSLNIIGLPNLSSGVYLLNINDKGTTQTIKVMVRK
ncbi:MAG: T9SS type A sorting domain-containing protein [Mariniphaga sp.]